MEYIKLLNGFDQWLESNTLPVQSQLLWYRLAARANRAGWPEWVQVENRELMAMVKVTREATFIEKVRSPLLENNLIEYRKGKKGCPGRYRFCYIEIGVGKGSKTDKQSNCPTFKQDEKGKTSENVVESVVNSVVESVVQSVADSVALYRPDQTRPDQEEAIASSTSSAPTAAEEPARRIDYQAIMDLYHRICVSYPRLRGLSEKRKKAIQARISQGYTLEDFERLFTAAEESNFLKGGNNRNWRADFDWLIQDNKMTLVLEGRYSQWKDKTGKPCENLGRARNSPHSYDLEEIDQWALQNTPRTAEREDVK